MKFKQSSSAH